MLSLERQNALRDWYRRQRPGWQPATERFAALVREQLTPASLLLDLGCGRGGLVEQLGHPLEQVLGADPDLASLQEHRLPLPRLVANSEALPLAAGRLDLVYASWVLEHVQEPEALWREIHRVLKPGGAFVSITPNRRHPLIGANRFLGRLGRLQRELVSRLYQRASEDTFPAYYRANEPHTLRRQAQRWGFDEISLEGIADPTYLAFSPALFQLAIRVEERWLAGRPVHLVGCWRKGR